jgi:hypothetical protein
VTPGPDRRGEAAALAALALLLLILNVTPITNNDLFLHLRTGETILKTGSVPRVDDYSALAGGRPFIAHEWLAGVVFRLVQMALGWNGLILLKALSAIAVAALLYAAARLLGSPPAVAVPALTFVMILASWRGPTSSRISMSPSSSFSWPGGRPAGARRSGRSLPFRSSGPTCTAGSSWAR